MPSRDSSRLGVDEYLELRDRLASFGYGDEYAWAQSVATPQDAFGFFFEYAWVVVNSGMKNQVAEKIFRRVCDALRDEQPVASAFRHPGKAAAIQDVFDNRDRYYMAYLAAADKIAYLGGLPWIGEITKWHLAKNFGVDCAKPDRHLVRLSGDEGTTGLCQRIADATGDRIGTVDLVLWRAANLGWI